MRKTLRQALNAKKLLILLIPMFLVSCDDDEVNPPVPDPGIKVYQIPVVIHVLHLGEPLGEGYNLSEARIEGQIRILNEDYRRKEGTPGFNTHPDGGDARVEFVLAKSTPDGKETDGVIRVNITAEKNPMEPPYNRFDYYTYYGYWDPEKYLNVWVEPLPESIIDIFLGEATLPETDLPGYIPHEPYQTEGVLINSAHFGASDINSQYNLGRTLTHEIGHYLGLLHPWGSIRDPNDYCEDTPPTSRIVSGCPTNPPLGNDGRPIMIENYMNYTSDRCMNVFTTDQIARMHYVLENSPMRKSLADSPGLQYP